MKKRDVIEFIEVVKDCEDIERVYIEGGIRQDYIEVKYYDGDGIYKRRSAIYKR